MSIFFWTFLSCVNNEQSLTQALELTQIAIKSPSKAIQTCEQIIDVQLTDHCLSLAAAFMENETTKSKVCQSIQTPQFQDECYFEIADSSKEAEWCESAGQFQTDCNLHMLQSHGGRYHQLSSLIDYSKSLGLDLDDNHTQNMLFSIFLQGKANIPIEQCQNTIYQRTCEQYAVRYYKHNLALHKPKCDNQPRLFQSKNNQLIQLWTNYCHQDL